MANRYVPLYSRIGPIENSVRSVYERPGSTILGKGPGSATDSYFSVYTGRFFGSEEAGRAQLSVSLLEIGSLGVLLFLLVILQVFRMNNAFRKRTDDRYWKSISFGFEGLILLFVLGTVYLTIWTSDVLSFTFWLMASAIYGVSQRVSCDARPKNLMKGR
jgi:O-antigen ligase